MYSNNSGYNNTAQSLVRLSRAAGRPTSTRCGAVVPEVVTWEKNGTDAQGIDYSRLTALLIEATKEQQALIHKQQEQIVRLIRQVKTIQATLKADRRSGSAVRTVKAEGKTVRQ